jgi:hypothetical protein
MALGACGGQVEEVDEVRQQTYATKLPDGAKDWSCGNNGVGQVACETEQAAVPSSGGWECTACNKGGLPDFEGLFPDGLPDLGQGGDWGAKMPRGLPEQPAVPQQQGAEYDGSAIPDFPGKADQGDNSLLGFLAGLKRIGTKTEFPRAESKTACVRSGLPQGLFDCQADNALGRLFCRSGAKGQLPQPPQLPDKAEAPEVPLPSEGPLPEKGSLPEKPSPQQGSSPQQGGK